MPLSRLPPWHRGSSRVGRIEKWPLFDDIRWWLFFILFFNWTSKLLVIIFVCFHSVLHQLYLLLAPQLATYLLPTHRRRTGMLPHSLLLSHSCIMLAKSSLQANAKPKKSSSAFHRSLALTASNPQHRPRGTMEKHDWARGSPPPCEPVSSLYIPPSTRCQHQRRTNL